MSDETTIKRLLERAGYAPSFELGRTLTDMGRRMAMEQAPLTDEPGLNSAAKRVGRLIGAELPPDVGFALLLFNFGRGGFLSWISNAERGDMIRAVKEWLQSAFGVN